MKYLIKPTKNGWYVAVNNTWKNWSVKSGWFTPIDVLWCLEVWKFNNPRYVSVSILGLGLEIGKFKENK